MKKMSKMHGRVNNAVKGVKNEEELAKNKRALEHAIDLADDPDLKKGLEALDHVAMPPDKFWDKAEEFYQQTIKSILDTNENTALHLQDWLNRATDAQKQDQKLVVLINSLNRDVHDQLARLNNIHEQHKQYSGACKTPDEIVLLMDVNSQYSEVMEIFHTLIAPTAGQIFELTGVYDQIAEQSTQVPQFEKDIVAHVTNMVEERQVELQNPNIVSDVQFKEV